MSDRKITKPKSNVWNHFDLKKLEGKVVYTCKFCASEYVKNATRMTKHLLKCLKCPSNIKRDFKIVGSENVSSPSSTAASSLKDQCEEEETLTKAASISGSFGDTEYESIAANIQIKISEANALGVRPAVRWLEQQEKRIHY
ncbi:unnamed protein product [Acanthoscelides obtectus]|uniref:BED-type domain-containing protein n=1 Tax=Acanthoscelides obtectus TaxID=200917 RepID=A0A9P0Q812_ACAOB|nr:unnamed protein product [Acanthoscelides obtectus]CAK1671597.1 hypothetical protein AOBTE_LOCUS28352 [Acanthoscelides obtectus]